MHEEIESMIKKTRDRMRRRLAPAFHQPKFVIDSGGDGGDTFRSLDPKTYGGVAKVAKNVRLSFPGALSCIILFILFCHNSHRSIAAQTMHFFNMMCYAGFLITFLVALLVRANIQAGSDVQVCLVVSMP